MEYVDDFMGFKCSGDVLNIVNPIGSKSSKEITESMGAIKKIRNICIKEPMKYTLYDFCAGNALTSVLAVHLLPVKRAVAIDKRLRNRRWDKAKRFEYQFEDIYTFDPETIQKDSIIVSIHPCANLANRVVEIYNQSAAKHLVLIPCCKGAAKSVPQIIKEKIGSYLVWCWDLANQCNGEFIIDEKILSPKKLCYCSK